MLMYMTDDVQTKAIEYDDQTLHEQFDAIQAECLVLRKHYQTLYEHFHALLERSPVGQIHDLDRAAYRQAIHDYGQSLQEQRRVIQHFRRSLLTHVISTRSYRSKQPCQRQAEAGRPLVRKTVLLATDNEQDAALLKASMQQARTYRVFVAADWSEVLCLVQNVHIDVLVLGDELTALPGIELHTCVQSLKGLEGLPTIVMSNCLGPLHDAERAHSHLMGLERLIKGDILVKVIEQLLMIACVSPALYA
jgi:PleD family two-component response regulator